MFITCAVTPYIGYYFGLGRRVAFTETHAELFSYKDETSKKYDLKLFFPPEMPARCAFLDRRRIKWFLRSGYEPTLVESSEGDKVMTFVLNGSSNEALCRDCMKIQSSFEKRGEQDLQIAGLAKDSKALAVTLLSQFLRNIKEGKREIALSCIEKALEVAKGAIVVKRLFADTLFFLKDSRSCKHYLELEKLSSNHVDLERAILSDPSDPALHKRIKKSHYSDEVKRSLQVVGYLASMGKVCEFCQLDDERTLTPIDFLAHRQFCEDKELKKRFLFKAEQKTAEIKARLTESGNASPLQRIRRQAGPFLRNGTMRASSEGARKSPTLSKLLGDSLSSIRRASKDSGISLPSESGATKAAKEEFLFQIDILIQAKRLQEAKTKADEAIKQCGMWGPFYERKLCLLPKKPTPEAIQEENECLKQLLWDVTQSHERIEYVARRLFERQQSYDVGVKLAETYAALGKIKESARLYYLLVKTFPRHPEVEKVLKRIQELDTAFSFFSEIELKVLYLLGLSRDAPVPDLSRKVSPRSCDVPVVGHTGETAFFCIEHPEYIACWISLEEQEQFLFTKEHVEIVSLVTGIKEKPLTLIFSDEVPIERSLFSSAAVQWLLGSGYRPIRTPAGCAFTQIPPDTSGAQLLQKAYREVRRVQNQNLFDFINHFKRGNFGLAHESIQKVSSEFSDLYADFLEFLKHPDAIGFLRRMGATSENEQKLLYMQRALCLAVSMRSPVAYTIYVELARLLPAMGARLLYLHGFLYFTIRAQNQKLAADCFLNADPLLRLCAKAAFSQESDVKEEAYQELAHIPGLTSFYTAKLAALRSSNITVLAAEFEKMIDDGAEKDMERAFSSSDFREILKNIKKEARKLPAGDLPEALERLETSIAEKRFRDAKLQLFEVTNEKNLPDQFRQKAQELQEAYESDLKHVFRQEGVRPLPIPTVVDIKEKCEKIQSVGARVATFLERFKRNLDSSDNFLASEVALLQTIDCARVPTYYQIVDLYIHFLLFLQRDDVIDYCLKYLEDKKKISDGSSDKIQTTRAHAGVKNWLSLGVQSEALYYLEQLLQFCLQKKEPEVPSILTVKVYNKIFEVFEARNISHSLLALHACLYLRERDPAVAKQFYDKIDAEHPLLPCATLALLPLQAKALRREQYAAMMQFFEDGERVRAYVATGLKSSLQDYVHSQCLEVLSSERMRQVKRIGLVFVDTLIERGLLHEALDMQVLVCSILNSGSMQVQYLPYYSYIPSVRFIGERFSIIKREATCNNALGNIRNTEYALQKLKKRYQAAGKVKKRFLCAQLCFKMTKSQDAFSTLMREHDPQQKAALCLENAFRSIASDNLLDARESLETLRMLDAKFTEDEQLMLQLIEELCDDTRELIGKAKRLSL